MELSPDDRLLRSCRGQAVDRPPVWLMRQAGRYLPQYRAVREGVNFLDMCRDVERAVKVSLQPIELVGSEAVIMFQDIFTPIPGMGVEVDFAPGPVVADPIRTVQQVAALQLPDPRKSVPFVFEILRELRSRTAQDRIPVLGFAGAPFTLAAYLIEGSGSRHFERTKQCLYRQPDLLRALLDHLAELTIAYLNAQVEAGAQAVQLFDTWAGLLGRAEYQDWVLPYHRRVIQGVKPAGAPFILYVNEGAHVIDSMVDAGPDVISLDWRVDLAEAAGRYGDRVSLQGNLDPLALSAAPEEVRVRVQQMVAEGTLARGYIANLGHGCLPSTPVEGVRAFTEAVRSL